MIYRVELQKYIRANAQPPDKFSHQARLYELTRIVGQAEGKPYDDDVVFAAAWLHDLGVFAGHRPDELEALKAWDHVKYVIGKAPGLLGQFGFPADKIPGVLEAIRHHMPQDTPTSYEGVLLRDADILEQLGAVGILRTVSKVGRDTRFIYFSDALKVLAGNLEKLPGQLALAASRNLAESRIAMLSQFLASASVETGDIAW